MQITFASIPDIPKGGTSIPIAVQLQYGPYEDISLLFFLSTVYSGLSIFPKKMQFNPGNTVGYYKISVSNMTQASSSQINIVLLGSNANVYTLSETTLKFNLYVNDTTLPDVTSIAITQIHRASAASVITTNKVCTVYYAYALFGTIAPSYTELMQSGPPSYDTSRITYGVLFINSSLVANVTLTGLSADTSYVIFAIAVDQSSLLMRTANFSTLSIYSPAIITLWFSQTYLTNVEIDLILSTIGLVIGLES